MPWIVGEALTYRGYAALGALAVAVVACDVPAYRPVASNTSTDTDGESAADSGASDADDDDGEEPEPRDDDGDDGEDGTTETGTGDPGDSGSTGVGGCEADVWYRDVDGDGFGDFDDAFMGCEGLAGYVRDGGDCNDFDAHVNPSVVEICDTVDNDCDAVIDEVSTSNLVCFGCINAQHEDFAYMLCPRDVTWLEARQGCSSLGADLTSVHSEDENAFLAGHMPRNGGSFVNDFWIGLSDAAAEGFFAWVDGTAFDYDGWGSGEPNDDGGEDCTEMLHADGGWNDAPCDSGSPDGYVCRAYHPTDPGE